jgi:hypothetical protein
MFIPYTDQNYHLNKLAVKNKKDFIAGYWHILGGVLFKIDKKYYISALDESSYFVTQLKTKFKPKTFNDAVECLKPESVKLAESYNQEVLRQGEYFFINTGLNDYDLAKNFGLKITHFRKLARQRNLPNRENRTNNHSCILFHENLIPNLKLDPKIKKLEKEYNSLKIKYTNMWIKNILKALNEIPKKDYIYNSITDITLYNDIDSYEQLKENPDTNKIIEFLRDETRTLFQIKEYEIREKIARFKKRKKSVKFTNLFGKGMVSHSAQEHRPLRLKKDNWYEIYKNTEVQSWNFTGQFD